MRLGFTAAVIVVFLLSVSCTTKPPMPISETEIEIGQIDQQPVRLEFLTRDGCKNTPRVSANLEKAVANLDQKINIQIVHQSTLSPDDPRIGYPTPTILLNGEDIFGSSRPIPPFPAPS